MADRVHPDTPPSEPRARLTPAQRQAVERAVLADVAAHPDASYRVWAARAGSRAAGCSLLEAEREVERMVGEGRVRL